MFRIKSVIILSSLFSIPVFGQAVEDIDFSFEYVEDKPVEFSYRYAEDEIKIRFISNNTDALEVSLLAYQGISTKRPEKTALNPFCVANECTLSLDPSLREKYLEMVIEYKTPDVTFYSHVPEVRKTHVMLRDAFGDILFGNYVNSFTDIVVEVSGDDKKAEVFYYTHEFLHADPPMGVTDVPGKSLKPDTVVYVQNRDVVSLIEPGFYFFREEGEKTGISLRVEPDPYPKYNKLEDLKKPLIYITTQNEWGSLEGKPFTKAEFDNIWLDMARFENNASKAVRVYYKRIEHANMHFTHYKPGWKTDMGLVYTVFGPPDRVKKSRNGEIWEYASTLYHGRQSFTFFRKRNAFADNFILRRKKEYLYDWNNTVEILRSGKVE